MATSTATPSRATTASVPATRSPLRLWLTVLGVVLVLVAILGMIGAMVDLMHKLTLHIEGGEMVLHWLLAALTLALAFAVKDDAVLNTIGMVYGAVYLLVGIVGFFMDHVGNAASPAWHVALGDNLLHLALGIVTIAAAMASKGRGLRA